MTGSDWLAMCPEANGPSRDAYVLAAVGGPLTVEFARVRSDWRGHTAFFSVTADAAYVAQEDGSRYRPQTSARLLQSICDASGCVMPTEFIADLIWEQAAVRLAPQLMPAGPQMSLTSYSREYNKMVEKERAGRTGLLANVGKFWVLSSRMNLAPHTAANYGWTGDGPAIQGVKLCDTHHGYKVIQPLSTRHDFSHTDESQLIQMVGGECEVDGAVMKTLDLMQDSKLNGLFSYEESFPVKQQ